MAPEQQDRFAEPRSTLCSHFARTTDPLDKPHQLHGRHPPLLDSGPSQVGHHRPCGSTKLMTYLSGHRSPAMQHCAGRCIARSALRAVAIEPLEIEGSCAESEDPALEGAPRDADVSRHGRQGNSVGERLTHRLQDDLHPGDLAGQCIPGQHPLAVPTTPTPRHRNREGYERVSGLEPSCHPTASKPEIASVACSTTTAEQQLVTGPVDGCRIAARLHVEYENHVLMTAPG
jgi:hypothetical protein